MASYFLWTEKTKHDSYRAIIICYDDKTGVKHIGNIIEASSEYLAVDVAIDDTKYKDKDAKFYVVANPEQPGAELFEHENSPVHTYYIRSDELDVASLCELSRTYRESTSYNPLYKAGE